MLTLGGFSGAALCRSPSAGLQKSKGDAQETRYTSVGRGGEGVGEIPSLENAEICKFLFIYLILYFITEEYSIGVFQI